MQELQMMNEGSIGAIIPMLWVFGLMVCVIISHVGHRREGTTIRQRVGIELEVIRDEHSMRSPNQSIANWIDSMRSRNGQKYVDEYFKTLSRRRQYYLKTRREKRIAVAKSLPNHYQATNFEVASEGWSHGQTEDYTKVTTDGSVNDGGFEVVSHPLMDGKHHGWIAIVATLLRNITRVDRSCGLHVHIGLRDPQTSFDDEGQISRREAMGVAGRCSWAYSYFTDAFNTMVSKSRHDAQYLHRATHMMTMFPSATEYTIKERLHHESEPIPDDPEQGIVCEPVEINDHSYGFWISRNSTSTGESLWHKMYAAASEAGRYYHCNVRSLLNRPFGTVEYRQHQGTSNPVKISYWVELMYLFTNRTADETSFNSIQSYPPTREGLWAYLDLASDDPLVDYYNKRAVVLSGRELIRECDICRSKACVHWECAGVDSVAIKLSARNNLYGRDEGEYECESCDSSVAPNDVDNMEAYCNWCESNVSVRHASGLLASIALGLLVSAPIIGAFTILVGCGIGAIHVGSKKFMVKKGMKSLWSGLASRGKQAAGFAWQGRSADYVWHLKAPTSSEYMVKHVDKYVKKSTVWTMFHTRYATHGVNNTDNAHPHFGPKSHVTMVHNGVVHNSPSVWKGLNIDPTGPVDSQAVAACLEIGGIESVVEHCEGSMSLIWSDTRDPKGTLKFWSNGGNPLYAGRLDNPNTGALVVASTEEHMRASQGKRLKTCWAVKVGREYTVSPDGSITQRDIEGSEETAGLHYDWRTYAKLYGKDTSKSSKTRKITVKSSGKAGGSGDNCTLPAIVPESVIKRHDDYNFTDEGLNDAINQAWLVGSLDGFAANGEYHGYNGITHSGVRPDGTTYYLPNYYENKPFDPMMDTDHMVLLLSGEVDPQFYYEEDDMRSDYDVQWAKDTQWDEHWSTQWQD